MADSSSTDTLRMTRQRRVILDELRRVDTHPTADELYALVRRVLPRISLGTVYRNLEILAERGLIRRLDGAGGKRRYDGDVGHHYHVRCERCGRMGDVHMEPIAIDKRAARRASAYRITGIRLELAGICPKCRAGSK